jgi:Subtilase family
MRVERRSLLCITLSVVFSSAALLAQDISTTAIQQITDLTTAKASFTPSQRKQSSDLVFAALATRNLLPPSISPAIVADLSSGMVMVDIRAGGFDAVLAQIIAVGGQVHYSSPPDGAIRASLPLLSIDSVAALAEVRWIRSADMSRTNGPRVASVSIRWPSTPQALVWRQMQRALPQLAARRAAPWWSNWLERVGLGFFIGAVTSQGYVTHGANTVVGTMGINGTGVKVGVLSDSASSARVAALIASGDLPPDVTVVPGQASSGSDEGTAMMEIVHDLAPGAKLFFATANGGQANFANNIRTLRFTYGCDIIVDDFTYFAEGAFQDGTIAKAVNDVVANGALYFSSAANSGSLDLGTSGTWEGDFVDGGAVAPPISATGRLHSFGSQNFDVLTATTNVITLKWSDPLGASANDYDLYILDSAGATVKGFSNRPQTGTQDPFEQINRGVNCGTPSASGYCPAIGDRIVVVQASGARRALRLDTNRGILSIGTDGSTFGHNAGLNTVSTAATAWSSCRCGTRPFTGAANPVEVFSSDGPRKIFYNPDGTPITPGNLLFGTNGGVNLQKPDITAADGVFTRTPGFLPFFGTSAAAPHAAAVAALVKSAKPTLTNTQIYNILITTTVDRDSGYGIVMAVPAVQKALLP